ncbi:hypothetical protein J3R08_004692 [Micromonospora sp. HB375]|uniref:hypothetical protein n=1 Tax=unclassified Micromonospora TaxID=2617518 RepID=UPI001AE3B148|nr:MULTISPECIES: hypothetical protein [unclassified Micromonospora]MBP1784842.1 hypothetical protein [Micromonospora sp. HB375]MDH6471502.1 hypothetical protein [Micromonospora sp. H404/HB375]
MEEWRFTQAAIRESASEMNSDSPHSHATKAWEFLEILGPSISQQVSPGGAAIVSARDTLISIGAQLRTKQISDEVVKEARSSYFILPSEYDDLLETLWCHGLLVIEAPPGKGKRALGVRMLSDCQARLSRESKPARGLHYIKMGWQEIDAWQMPKTPGRCYLLDLTGSTDEKPTREFGQELVRDSDEARYDGVYLVVLATPDVWDACKPVTSKVTRSFTPPAARQVLESHLQWKFQLSGYERWLDDNGVQDLVNSLEHLNEAAELAEEIARNWQREFAEALSDVLDKFGSWTNHLSSWFEGKSVFDRATMVSAAVLDPGLPAEIMSARKELLTILESQDAELSPLAGPGRTGYLKLLGAVQVKNKFSISERRPGLDEAVIRFVWNEWPQAHPYLEKWLVRLADGASPARVARIAHVTVQAALQANSTAFMSLVHRIVVDDPGSRRLALEILDLTVLDPVVGAKVRNRLLAWVGSKNEDLAALAAEVCGGKFGRERPSLALHRIFRALSRDTRDNGVVTAESALVQLTRDEISRVAVRETVRSWLSEQPEIGAPAFLALATRSTASVSSGLGPNATDDDLSFFALGWEVAARLPSTRSELAMDIGRFIDICEKEEVRPVDFARVVGPVLADSLNETLAVAVLRQDKGRNHEGESLRAHLLKELIRGQLRSAKRGSLNGQSGGS